MSDDLIDQARRVHKRIAFYAPLKSPLHPQPSGDRLVARLLMTALERWGYQTELASQLRTWEGDGDGDRQARLRDIGTRLGQRLLRRYAREQDHPDLWFTYHTHHKAPDWIGPVVSAGLGIPYVVAEASYAPKQDGGPWHTGHVQCGRSIRNADVIFSLNGNDVPCLRPIVKPSCRLVDLQPFLITADIEVSGVVSRSPDPLRGIASDVPRLVCVAMMRDGDKLASFRQLAEVLAGLVDEPWRLVIVGDGEARDRVAQYFEPVRQRVTMTGAMDPQSVYATLKTCDIYIWPAVNEAYGMSLLEAQACGLPVVAASVGGVPSIVEHEKTGLLASANDIEAQRTCARRLLSDPVLRHQMGKAAQSRARHHHDIAQASRVLGGVLDRLFDR